MHVAITILQVGPRPVQCEIRLAGYLKRTAGYPHTATRPLGSSQKSKKRVENVLKTPHYGYMRHNILTCLILALSIVQAQVQNATQLYLSALQLADKIPTEPHFRLYSDDNIDNNVYVPQFDPITRDYVHLKASQPRQNARFAKQVLPLLEEAAELHNSDAAAALGDIYVFGNFSTPANYSKALNYYQQAVVKSPHGHAYFMLGFLYSTGLFGEMQPDDVRAALYYRFGAENGDLNALLVLAYRHFKGIGTPTNCDMARLYYSKWAHIGMGHIQNAGLFNEKDDGIYNIRLQDFNGGIYGPHISESPTSILGVTRTFSSSRSHDYSLEGHDHEYVDYYFDAMELYSGDYFIPQNYSLAFQVTKECVTLGLIRYGSRNYLNINKVDRFFLSRCQQMLGHMYLKGHGVLRNHRQAYRWLSTAVKIDPSFSDAHHDLGVLYQSGPVTDGLWDPRAVDHLQKAHKSGSPEASLDLANSLIARRDREPATAGNSQKEIFRLMRTAVYKGGRDALFQFGDLLEAGLGSDLGQDQSCETTTTYYKYFVERLEKHMLPHLKYAFEEFTYGNYKNALVGYLMAAEQGLENAEVSAAFLLYQYQPWWRTSGRKTFEKQRVLHAIKYLERAVAQNNVDAAILLGDIAYYGEPSANISSDYNKAFAYYNSAVRLGSSHGSYNLGYMYEYGLGPLNNTVDYFMAKRYYDQSLHDKAELGRASKYTDKLNTIPINLALLRLRIKFLFNKSKYNGLSPNESGGWLSAFKNIGGSQISETEIQAADEQRSTKAQDHHEGTSYYDEEEEYDLGDYFVLGMTFLFFAVIFAQNIYRQIRQLRNRRNGVAQPEEQPQAEENGRNANGLQFRGNFQFQFFAL